LSGRQQWVLARVHILTPRNMPPRVHTSCLLHCTVHGRVSVWLPISYAPRSFPLLFDPRRVSRANFEGGAICFQRDPPARISAAGSAPAPVREHSLTLVNTTVRGLRAAGIPLRQGWRGGGIRVGQDTQVTIDKFVSLPIYLTPQRPCGVPSCARLEAEEGRHVCKGEGAFCPSLLTMPGHRRDAFPFLLLPPSSFPHPLTPPTLLSLRSRCTVPYGSRACTDNRADYRGGAISVDCVAACQINDSCITGNMAPYAGGVRGAARVPLFLAPSFVLSRPSAVVEDGTAKSREEGVT